MAPRLQTYLDLVGFRQLTDDFEQIKHLLYYITVVAGIRQDMTAKVIASRLAWLKKVPHEKIKEYEQHVEDLIRRNSDIFEEIPELDTTKPIAGGRTWDPRDPANTDRRSGETAYALYDNVRKQLDKEADNMWDKSAHNLWGFLPSRTLFIRRDIMVTFAIFSFLGIGLVTILGALYFYYCPALVWGEYAEKMHLDKVDDDNDKARHLLFYITQLVELTADMTPALVSETLSDTRLGTVNAERIERYFEDRPWQYEKSPRAGAYKLSYTQAEHMAREYRGDAIEVPVKVYWAGLTLLSAGLLCGVYFLGEILQSTQQDGGIRKTGLQKFRDIVQFDRLDEPEKIKHLVYYITVVAGIRQDMTAKVIASRLAWLKNIPHEKIKEYEQHVEDLIRRNSDIFEEIPELDTTKPVAGRRTWDPRDPANTDRRSGETAYALYDNAIKQIDKDVDEKVQRFFSPLRTPFRPRWYVAFWLFFLSLMVAGVVIAVLIYGYRNQMLSWPRYMEETQMASKSGDEKAKYALFYVTRYIKLTADMTPEVIEATLEDSGLGSVDRQDIRRYVEQTRDQVEEGSRKGAYKMLENAADHIMPVYRGGFMPVPMNFWLQTTVVLAILAAAHFLGRLRGKAKQADYATMY